MAATPPRRIIRLTGLATLAGASLVAAFGLAEWALRAAEIPYRTTWIPSETAIARFDPLLGWSYRPHLEGVQRNGEHLRPVVTDGHGLRVRSPADLPDPAAPTLLLVGGSIAFGHGLSWDESLAGRLESRLGLQVANLGTQAYGTDQAMLALERHHPRFERVVAVAYVFIDDHVLRNGVADRRLLIPFARFVGTKPRFELGPDGRPRLASVPVPYEKYVHSWLVDLVRIRIGGTLGMFPPRPTELTGALVAEMGRIAGTRGARFVVVHWRSGTEPERTFLRQPGAELVDTGVDPPPGWERMTIPGDGHPDAQAHDHVAGLLAAVLATGPAAPAATTPEVPR